MIQAALTVRQEEMATPAAALQRMTEVATTLLSQCLLHAGGRTFRLGEVEFYYQDPGPHLDVFAHADPLQRERGRWYFHKTNGEYRGGTYKGLDITFGDGVAFGGALIRGVVPTDGAPIDGPCLSVDQLLRDTHHGSVAELDAAVAARPVWDTTSPLHLAPAPTSTLPYRTARIGLTLKRCPAKGGAHLDYILRPYRFLSTPDTTKKGKVHLAAALKRAGAPTADVLSVTRSPRKTVERWLSLYDQGLAEGNLLTYRGRDLTPDDLATMHGIWTRTYGQAFAHAPAIAPPP